jgi:hypothetical protein
LHVRRVCAVCGVYRAPGLLTGSLRLYPCVSMQVFGQVAGVPSVQGAGWHVTQVAFVSRLVQNMVDFGWAEGVQQLDCVQCM